MQVDFSALHRFPTRRSSDRRSMTNGGGSLALWNTSPLTQENGRKSRTYHRHMPWFPVHEVCDEVIPCVAGRVFHTLRSAGRSEERRVGKECRCRGWTDGCSI